jgi:hypothetical protein
MDGEIAFCSCYRVYPRYVFGEYHALSLFKKSLKIPKGNQNPHIEEQTKQWPKEKVQKDKQQSTKRPFVL